MNGLLNDNLLPLTHDWRSHLEQASDLPALIKVNGQLDVFAQIAAAWSKPDLQRTRIIITRKVGTPSEQLSMILTLPVKIPQIPSIMMFWDLDSVFEVTLGESAKFIPSISDSLTVMKDIMHFLERSTHSDQYINRTKDFIALFGPDIAESELDTWLRINESRKNALDAFLAGDPTIRGFVRTAINGKPHIFCNWLPNFETKGKDAVNIECVHLPKRRNFQDPAFLTDRATLPHADTDNCTNAQHFLASDCTIDSLDSEYARFTLFLPSILRHIEMYSVAQQLQTTIMRNVRFRDLAKIVTAITAPSAQWITNYQRYEFIGDAILKLETSIQLSYVYHGNWPEGYLSQRKDSLVSNSNLARAALSRSLDRYIILDTPKTRKWFAPRISHIKTGTAEREMSMKLLADVTEALIGAAFIDSGFDAARACINVFVPEINASRPDFQGHPLSTDLGNGYVDLETLLAYRFRNKQLLQQALTHPTWGIDSSAESYQRLEFLGDAVLDVLIATYLSKCKPELSQGQMTQIKIALANAPLLGFLCLDFGVKREIVHIEEKYEGHFTKTRDMEQLQLWKFMRHHSQTVSQAQKETNKRYEQYRGEIQSCLNNGGSYPWIPLARLNPNKFYSDMVESIIGAIFVDSRGQLENCHRFFDLIGLEFYASRMANGSLDVVHPRNRLQRIAGSSKLELDVVHESREREDGGTAHFRCIVKLDGNVQTEVGDCRSREEAVLVGAEAAISCLSSPM